MTTKKIISQTTDIPSQFGNTPRTTSVISTEPKNHKMGFKKSLAVANQNTTSTNIPSSLNASPVIPLSMKISKPIIHELLTPPKHPWLLLSLYWSRNKTTLSVHTPPSSKFQAEPQDHYSLETLSLMPSHVPNRGVIRSQNKKATIRCPPSWAQSLEDFSEKPAVFRIWSRSPLRSHLPLLSTLYSISIPSHAFSDLFTLYILLPCLEHSSSFPPYPGLLLLVLYDATWTPFLG